MTHDADRWSPSDELLDRFLAERTAPDERAAVEAWLSRTPAGWRTIQAMRRLRFSAVGSDAEQKTLWQRLEQRCTGVMEPQRVGRWHREETVRWGMWSTAAALVLGLIVLVIGWPIGARHSGGSATESTLAYTTGRGERATITLPDGGTVALNVGSRLEVPVDYVAGHHTVRLVGEGFFTVPHQDGAPFTVLAGGTATRVLGTSFVVRRYATDTTTLVAVRDGKVTVGSTVVTAAHLVEVGRTGVARVRPSDGSPFTFATGVLTLSGVPLPTAIAELDRWFDADIRLGSPTLATEQIKGAFAAGSLADLTEDLEFVLGVRVVRNGRVLTLFPKE